jgi:hypothetical protein
LAVVVAFLAAGFATAFLAATEVLDAAGVFEAAFAGDAFLAVALGTFLAPET